MVEKTRPKAKARRPKAESIVDRLAGKRIFLTGVTGFLGQVILERLLADFPETRIVLLVRSQTGASSVERVHYLTRKPSFDCASRVPRLRRRAPATPRREGRGRRRRLLARAARAPGRHRRRDPLRGDGRVRSADRRGLPDEPARCDEPLPRCARRRIATGPRPRVDRLRRGGAEGRDPGTHP